ncbi:glutamyl-tRNA(Gln) amidotransferase subunit A, mitochondrial [Copidosoma floridanum]|uniref:glutamyl-tRNA(Gln) amidotransferase subunit A, mitochondrial n=1 Tax=Copidosoma floridanum TaxID=29053 RepID=UPI0006C9BE3F|nr:glutamyl-tRNA(Gln) amidotransferase subunit A, mitochondrial [Copidosoma floridanum]
MNNVLTLPIRTVGQKIAAGEIRPSELAKAALKVTLVTKPLNAFVTVTAKLAEQQALESDERQRKNGLLGSLDGVPIAVKDNFCVADQPTTCASLMLANFVPGYDATVYKKLKASGAVLIGKTNLDQFAMGSGTVDSYFGPSKNLWGSEVMKNYDFDDYFHNKEIYCPEALSKTDNWNIAGGSSGGSAIAVSTGSCFAALGSDSGGSTRNPASYCGLVGLKPTYGLVSRNGLIPLVNSLDVPGILTRTVDDAVIMLNTLAGPDPLDSTTLKKPFTPFELPSPLDISGLRIGVPKEYKSSSLTEEMSSNWAEVSQLLEEAGARILPVSLPHTEYSIVCYSVLNQCEVASNMARYDGLEYGHRAYENTSVEELYAKTRSEGFNDVVRSRILAGNYFLLAENYEDYFVRAMKVRSLIAQDFENVWQSGVDLLLTPTTLSDAPTYRDFISEDNQTQCSVQDFCTQPANMAGIPAVSIPIKLSRRGLPLSLQLMAPKLCEERLLGVAKWIEDVVKFPRLVIKEESLRD